MDHIHCAPKSWGHSKSNEATLALHVARQSFRRSRRLASHLAAFEARVRQSCRALSWRGMTARHIAGQPGSCADL